MNSVPFRLLTRAFPASIFLLTILTCLGCSQQEPPPPPEPVRVSNEALDLTITDLGSEWKVTINEGMKLTLAPADPEKEGTVEVLVGPEETGPNLVAAVEGHRTAIESLPEGHYSGARELSGPLGAAFYSRGRFTDGTSTIEETRIFALHPRSNRIIELVYRYPAGDDSSTRVGEMIDLLARIE